MAADTATRSFIVSPSDYARTAAITACRLNRDSLGGCIGFALEYVTGRDANRVVLFYNSGPGTTSYPPTAAGTPRVYTLAGCLPA